MMQTYMKVGAMASWYPMKKHASWIPALARVEEFYYLRHRSKKEAVAAFLKKYGNYDEDLFWIYDCGQTFYDWNFANLVRAYGDWNEADLHCKQAEEFLGLDKKTDSISCPSFFFVRIAVYLDGQLMLSVFRFSTRSGISRRVPLPWRRRPSVPWD